MPASPYTYALVVPMLLFGIYRRVRRNFGRQPLRRGGVLARTGLLALVALGLLAAAAFGSRPGLAGVAGLAGGAMLGLYGLRLTRFETTPQGQYYTPHGMLGLGLTALLLGRLAYRFGVLLPLADGSAVATDPAVLQRSPLTFALAGLLVGYYLCYQVGLLRQARIPAAQPAA